ncbi:cryptochrome/photolyase family protein [Halostella salina]|uniref:cryptochrome/photolyase family protein n=1 Tax=Halostella salina TaxID=1547897 RepID=UPI000EF7B721|nr:deoxyribodipyrimidine photo-lyase [Halostella salina]
MRLHWHRRDLRVADNRALSRAAADGPVVPVFVFDPNVLAHGSPPRVAFMLDALDALREAYRERGSDLVVRQGDPREVLPDLADACGADGVTWAKDYSGLARERDAAVRRALDDADVARESVHDAVHHPPGSITTNDGDPYSVFTYFGRKWLDREKESPSDPPTADDLAAPDAVDPGELPTLSDLGFDDPEADVPPASAERARDLLDAFVDGPIFEYEERRDYPADDVTSRLSAHLKWGTIGIREVYDATADAMAAAESKPDDEAADAAESVEEFQSQLAWREFYTHVLFYNPEVVSENYKAYENAIEWREDHEALDAWKRGKTGYPLVDAGMRQLREEGWMHNRVRMVVAAFLTKDLLIDWREGYDWFRQKLVDHDTANDNGGWQWAASTGTDAQPYFRIFNPTSQCEQYDPDGEYVREYVPELQDATAGQIHEWPDLSLTERQRTAPGYPAPIVDHGERREEAIETFERARGDE